MVEVIQIGGGQTIEQPRRGGIGLGGILLLLLIIGGLGVLGWIFFTGGAGGTLSGARPTTCPTASNPEPNTTKKVLVGFKLDRLADKNTEYNNLAFEVYDKNGLMVLIGSFDIGMGTVEHALWLTWSGGTDAIPGGKVIYKYTKAPGTSYQPSDIIWQLTVPIDLNYRACIYIPEKALLKR